MIVNAVGMYSYQFGSEELMMFYNVNKLDYLNNKSDSRGTKRPSHAPN